MSGRRLSIYSNIFPHSGSSEKFLEHFLATGDDAELGLFFLDAHWENYWPLPEEIEYISETGRKAVIVVDDFEVPGRTAFGYDDYGREKNVAFRQYGANCPPRITTARYCLNMTKRRKRRKRNIFGEGSFFFKTLILFLKKLKRIHGL